MEQVLNYTAKNYNRPISIEEISRIAFLESGYFCRFFKKHMGLTFLEYQNEVRLSYIYQDLLTTTDTLSMILERHGFTNYKIFRRMFFEHFHATPSQIRKQLQNASKHLYKKESFCVVLILQKNAGVRPVVSISLNATRHPPVLHLPHH